MKKEQKKCPRCGGIMHKIRNVWVCEDCRFRDTNQFKDPIKVSDFSEPIKAKGENK
jgi:ribosomal protein L37AE/L43A